MVLLGPSQLGRFCGSPQAAPSPPELGAAPSGSQSLAGTEAASPPQGILWGKGKLDSF